MASLFCHKHFLQRFGAKCEEIQIFGMEEWGDG
jgi:hypothetical protein